MQVPNRKLLTFCRRKRREIALVSQVKMNHNICGIRLYYEVRAFEEYRLGLKRLNLLEIEAIWA